MYVYNYSEIFVPLFLLFSNWFLWLSLRSSKPVCSIQDFYVPALNRSENHSLSTHNSSIYGIYFDLKLDNENNDKRIYYDTINLTFFYESNFTHFIIGNYTVPPFRQGHKKKARRKDWIPTGGRLDEVRICYVFPPWLLSSCYCD